MMDILQDLQQTIEYFDDPIGGGDIIGSHACRSAIKEITRLRAALAEREWQPIETATNNDVCLVWNDQLYSYEMAYRGNDGDFYSTVHCSHLNPQPTHWMPTPQPPEEK